MPNRKPMLIANWMRMRISCSLDKHGNSAVELSSNTGYKQGMKSWVAELSGHIYEYCKPI